MDNKNSFAAGPQTVVTPSFVPQAVSTPAQSVPEPRREQTVQQMGTNPNSQPYTLEDLESPSTTSLDNTQNSEQTNPVTNQAPQQTTSKSPSPKNGLLKKILIGSAIIAVVIFLATLGVVFITRNRQSPQETANNTIPDQQVDLGVGQAKGVFDLAIEGQESKLIVNGSVVSRGDVVLTADDTNAYGQISAQNLTGVYAYLLPNAAGTFCLDSNNCNYLQETDVTTTTVAGASGALQLGDGLSLDGNTIINTATDFTETAVNNFGGLVTIQGTSNQVSVNNSGGIITLSTPQDLAAASSPTFNTITLAVAGSQNGNEICDISNNCGYAGGTNAFVQNGNSFDETAVLGTNDANDLFIETNDANRIVIDSVNGHIGLGNNGGSDPVADDCTAAQSATLFGSTCSSVFNIQEVATDFSSEVLMGFNNAIQLSPGGDTSTGVIGSNTTVETASDASNYDNGIRGVVASVAHEGSGTLAYGLAGQFLFNNNGDGDVSQATGIEVEASSSGGYIQNLQGGSIRAFSSGGTIDDMLGLDLTTIAGGTVTNATGLSVRSIARVDANVTTNVGIDVQTGNGSADGDSNNTIGDNYGIRIRTATLAEGTIDNNYGLYVQDQSGIATGDNYNIYSAGAGYNLFEGHVGIGNASTPVLGTATLSVVDTITTAGVGIANAIQVNATSGGGDNTAILNELYTVGAQGYDSSYGLQSTIRNSSTGTTNLAIGINAQIINDDIGTITEANGIRIGATENGGGGTIVDNYGLFVEDQSGVGSNTSYNIYSAGAGQNWFGGRTDIGDNLTVIDSSPSDAAISAILTGDVAARVGIHTDMGGFGLDGSGISFTDGTSITSVIASSSTTGLSILSEGVQINATTNGGTITLDSGAEYASLSDGNLQLWAPSAQAVLQFSEYTDLEYRYQVYANGRQEWGDGTTPTLDTNLYRSAANVLATDDSFLLGTLGTTNTSTSLCRNSSNIIAGCSTTGAGAAFVQGGNSFGATATLGTNDSNALALKTAGTTKLTVSTSGNITHNIDTSISTTAAVETGYTLSFFDTGAVTTGEDETNGLQIGVTRTGASGAAVVNTFAGYFTATGSTGGTSTAAGILAAASGADTNNGIGGIAFQVGTNVTASNIGVQGIADTYAGTSGGTVTSAYGLQGSIAMEGGNTTYTTAAGLNIISASNGTGGTITSNYGVKIDAQTAGVSDYGLRVDAADTQTLWISGNADNTTAAAGIAFGASRDTNLYRSAADVLKTDDNLEVAGKLNVGTNSSLTQCSTIIGLGTCTKSFEQSFASTSTTTSTWGSNFATGITPAAATNTAANVAVNAALGLFGTQSFSGTNYGVNGASLSATSSGTVALIGGVAGSASQVGTGSTVTEAFGLQGSVTQTAGTLSTGYGLRVLSSTGTIATNYGIHVQTQTSGTTDYGLRVDTADTQTLWIAGDDASATTAAKGIAFGSARDVNLYRSAAGTLRTDGSIQLGQGANRTISVTANTTANGAGYNLTLTGGAADGTTTGNIGGAVALQGGAAAGSGNNNGGAVTIDGGAATGSGNVGNVYMQQSGSNVGIGLTSGSNLGGKLTVSTGNASTIGVRIAGAASQTADLTKYADSSGNMLASFTPQGASNQRLQFNIYNTLETTVTNYERLAQYADNTNSLFKIETQNGGTGTLRDLALQGGGGRVGIGKSTSVDYKLDVSEDRASSYVASFFNDGNNQNRNGIRIQAGADDGSGTTTYIDFLDGDGTEVGFCQDNAGSFACSDSSDVRTKTNINNTVVDAEAILNGLRVVDFNRIQNPDGPKITGFIAQEVQELYGQAVTVGANGYLGVARDQFVPILVQGHQNQEAKIGNASDRLDELEDQVASLMGEQGSGMATTNSFGSLNVSGEATVRTLTVTGSASIAGNLTVDGNATFAGNITIEGHIIGNQDTRGVVTMPAGATEVEHEFTAPYQDGSEPIIVLTATNTFAPSYRVESDEDGFKVFFQNPSNDPVKLNYQVQQ